LTIYTLYDNVSMQDVLFVGRVDIAPHYGGRPKNPILGYK